MSGKTVFMFPGQGSQSVGMRDKLGLALESQQHWFTEADQILGYELTRLIDQGPEEELTRTSNAQPALLATGVAFGTALMEKGYTPDIVMGHSLGEYSALVCAGVLSYTDALRLVRTRGILMEQAVVDTPGKMAAVIGADPEKLNAVVDACRKTGVLEITNYNSPGQLVLSGETASIEAAVKALNETRLGRVVILNVSAPFHCSMMRPMAEAFAKHLSETPFMKPHKTFIDNVTGLVEDNPEHIREKLVRQLYSPVLWEASMRSAAALGAENFLESGPGAVLSGLVKRTIKGVNFTTGEKLLASTA